jgi:RsiW-degrading membrane proteinase PrsW (M82 family)
VVAIYIILVGIKHPAAPLFALLPLVTVGVPLLLIDRYTPRPLNSRLLMLVWGATISIVSAVLLEWPLRLITHSGIALSFFAGPIEELAIFSGLWWLARRVDITTPLEAVMMISWCALGFAAVEDVGYFALAPHSHLAAVIIVRGIATPFGHPLFSSLSGVGYALYRRRHQIRWLVGGLAAAAILHTSWDAIDFWIADNAKHSSKVELGVVALVYFTVFFGIFVTWVVRILITRRRESREQCFRLPYVSTYAGLPAFWAAILASYKALRHYRASLAPKARPGFDKVLQTLTSMVHRDPLDPLQPQLASEALHQYHAWAGLWNGGAPPPAPATRLPDE